MIDSEGGPNLWVKDEARRTCFWCDAFVHMGGGWLGFEHCQEHGAPNEVARAFFEATVEKYQGWPNVPPPVLQEEEDKARRAWFAALPPADHHAKKGQES